MNIEDRVRAATRARTALVRDIRPLELPEYGPARARETRHTSRWIGWGAPIGAAAVVIALALVLVVFRQAGGTAPGQAAPAGALPIPASVPTYYAALADVGSASTAGPTPRQQVVVADDRTSHTLASVLPPAGQSFTGVTGATDDRTFVVTSYQAAHQLTTFYLLRITPSAAHPAQLTKLPIKPLAAEPTGLALSADGRELAVMFANSSLQLWTYSVSSGAVLGSWKTDADYWMLRAVGANAYGLSWLTGNRGISFRFDAYAQNSTDDLVTVRTLNVTAAGHDLLADSRLVLQVPLSDPQPSLTVPCYTSLATSDGSSVICGTNVLGATKQQSCATPPSLVGYSAATGKPVQVLYQDDGSCQGGIATPLWTNSSGSEVIGVTGPSPDGTGAKATAFALIAGRLTPLSALVGNAGPGGITF
jgi:hypothetical protein